YKGDWIVRHHIESGKTEVVAQGPVPKHCVPCSVLDPKRLIFYGGTAPGTGGEDEGVRFFAYDVRSGKVLYDGPDGPATYMIFANSSGRIDSNAGKEVGPLTRYAPEKKGPPEKIPGDIRIRSATQETPQGKVYTVSQGGKGNDSMIYSFDTKTEKVEE